MRGQLNGHLIVSNIGYKPTRETATAAATTMTPTATTTTTTRHQIMVYSVHVRGSLFLLVSAYVLFASPSEVKAIDCFRCVSHNGDNPACEDPFHHNYTSELLHQPCLAGRKGREGLFPATACVKVTGLFEESGDTMVVRTCALDSGTLTVDTELVRMSHCGSFYFDDRYVRGCVVSCTTDACNGAASTATAAPAQLLLLLQRQLQLRLRGAPWTEAAAPGASLRRPPISPPGSHWQQELQEWPRARPTRPRSFLDAVWTPAACSYIAAVFGLHQLLLLPTTLRRAINNNQPLLV